MQKIKPLSISIAFIAGVLCTGTAVASQPVEPELTFAPSYQVTGAQHTIYSTVRKVYMFSALDKDHNGKLSRAELPKDMHDLRQDFVRVDLNDDGQISPREYIHYADGTLPSYVGIYHAQTFAYSTNDAPRNNMLSSF